MKRLLSTLLLVAAAALFTLSVNAQEKPKTTVASAGATLPIATPTPPVTPIKLSDEDQRALETLADSINRMSPSVKGAEDQAARAERELAQANAFIAQYNTLLATRAAFLNRIAADVVGCKTTELDLGPGGRSVVRKMPAATESVRTTSPAPPANKEIKP